MQQGNAENPSKAAKEPLARSSSKDRSRSIITIGSQSTSEENDEYQFSKF